MNNNDIPDPFIGLNKTEVKWVDERDFESKRNFEISESELNFDDILLNCKMLDTICNVLLNGRLLFRGNNCFVGYIPTDNFVPDLIIKN